MITKEQIEKVIDDLYNRIHTLIGDSKDRVWKKECSKLELRKVIEPLMQKADMWQTEADKWTKLATDAAQTMVSDRRTNRSVILRIIEAAQDNDVEKAVRYAAMICPEEDATEAMIREKFDPNTNRIVLDTEEMKETCAYHNTGGGCLLQQLDDGRILPCYRICRDYSKKASAQCSNPQ